ncbi:MAG: sialidase family protein [Anaerolineae bacterium]
MEFNELRYQDPATQTYLGSPSLVKLPDGALLGIHDYFGSRAPRRTCGGDAGDSGAYHLTSVYRSDDDGATWRNLTHVSGAFWNSLHVIDGEPYPGAVYMLGVSHQYGHIVIRRSTDGGFTWSHPDDAQSGLLFRAQPGAQGPNYHCAPVPIAVHNGRLYRAFEDNSPLDWPNGFQACVISAPLDADLLNAANWRISEKLPFDPAWVAAYAPPEGFDKAGWLEGNVIVGPDGDLWNVLRVNARSRRASSGAFGELWNKVALVRVENEGRALTFDPATGFIDLPGGHSKFTIRRDPVTGHYLTLSNGVRDEEHPSLRSMLGLYASEDLRHWRGCATLLEDDSDLTWERSAALTGFQYVDWHFDGKDLIYLVRTAYDGAHNFHDANRVTFHRLRDYARFI